MRITRPNLTGSNRAAIFLNIQPLLGALLGGWWLGEPLTAFMVAGGALIPRFTNTQPEGFVSLQFSIPHAIAMLLMQVPSGPQWLSADRAATPAVKAVRSRIRRSKPTSSRLVASVIRPARVNVSVMASAITASATNNAATRT